jgi:pyrimidine-specific ribonucleoside hydrolase
VTGGAGLTALGAREVAAALTGTVGHDRRVPNAVHEDKLALMIDVIWDMETGDPDDFVTLLLLLGHPRVNLLGVTITPGTPDQVGVVRRALEWFDLKIPVGVFDLEHRPKSQTERLCVSAWHYKAYGDFPPSRDAVSGPDLLRSLCNASTTLVTGAPLKNLGAALSKPGFELGRLVVQGGFAGEGVVPPERQLEKFRGLVTCPTYNLNGDPRSALAVIASPAIREKRFVSKNVCHGVVYDSEMHARVGELREKSKSLARIWQGMQTYLGSMDSEGKKFHDPLAACCAIDPTIGTWAEVDLYREKGKWGSRLSPGSGVQIITGYDRAKFIATLTAS